MALGEKIKAMRKQDGLTQSQLAEKIGVHETTIRRWERGKGLPSIDDIKKLSGLFKIASEDFLDTAQKEDSQGDSKLLTFEWGGSNKIKIPDTPAAREMVERIALAMVANGGKAHA